MGNLFIYNNNTASEPETESYCSNSVKLCTEYINTTLPCNIFNKITTQPTSNEQFTPLNTDESTIVVSNTEQTTPFVTSEKVETLQSTPQEPSITKPETLQSTPLDPSITKQVEVVTKSRFF